MRPTINECSLSKRPSNAAPSAGIFLRNWPRARSASTTGSVVPETSASSIARPDFAHHVGGHAVELDPGVLDDLVQAVQLALAVADLALAVAREVAQRAHRLRRHQAGQRARTRPRARQPAPPSPACLGAR